ncbi:GGDEF domain-containing protein [Pseudobacteroides cellulosolvens]|uniref:Diguanylate cyclase n=1 Tax=Pseudobacteroides cellulosolvens ATCC 35603 = DSM 2933 TaxID=398512 RepID=A0A0L6JV17_9FIRM|nr:GGDEF domain-containing protein [Pseudobacteroides cellulosolvens]KNY29574.1 diguanylate cyclase [Pseudobacteroides cellulosolvens ATCC 35603 = DSM 2933]
MKEYEKYITSETEILKLKEENNKLADQVKLLVKTEYKLYNTQIYLDNQIELYKSLYSIGKKFTNILDIEELFYQMGLFILEKLNYGSYIIMGSKNNDYTIINKGGDFDKSPDEFSDKYELSFIKNMFCHLTINDERFYCSNYSCAEFAKAFGMDNFVIFNLDIKDEAMPKYFLIVGNPENNEFFSDITDNDLVIISVGNLVSFAMNALNNIYHYQELMRERELLEKTVEERTKDLNNALKELQKLNKKLHFNSMNDELTGLYNRRGFLVIGKKQFKSAKENKETLLIVYCDLDGLKKINDTFGHKEGDYAIKQTAELLKKTFRKSDVISRFGGDEYVILLTNNTEKSVFEIKNRLECHFKEFNQSSGKEYNLSISIGYACFNTELFQIKTFEELIQIADEKLYSEKRKKKHETKLEPRLI